MRNRLETWIRPGNLFVFLERLSAVIAYPFDEWDWDAVRFGVGDIAGEPDGRYEYELCGNPPVKLTFTGSGDASRLPVATETESATATRIDALARILQRYTEEAGLAQSLKSLVEEAFADTPQPDSKNVVACSDSHLAVCEECREILSIFGGTHWLAFLRGRTLPSGTTGALDLLTPGARRYFFPAYLITAAGEGNRDLLATAERSVAGQTWTPLQQELIAFARHLLHRRMD